MAIHIFQAAKQVGKYTEWSKSNLEIQKIVYIAHMFHLGKQDVSLVKGLFEAWDLGPVHPDLYHKVKVFGADPVKNIFNTVADLDEETQESGTLKRTLSMVSDYSGARLVGITHSDFGAWYKNYIPGEKGIIIPNSDIRDEYDERVRRFGHGRAAG